MRNAKHLLFSGWSVLMQSAMMLAGRRGFLSFVSTALGVLTWFCQFRPSLALDR